MGKLCWITWYAQNNQKGFYKKKKKEKGLEGEEGGQQQKEEAQGRNLKILHFEDEGGAHKGI